MGHDESYLDAAKRAAMVRTAGLGKRIFLTKEDREDVYQDLLMTLLEREAAFDPRRSSANTFTGVVSERRATDLMRRLVRDRIRLQLIDHEFDAANDPFIDGYESTAALSTPGPCCHDEDLFADSDTRRALDTALQFLSDGDRRLWDCLQQHMDLRAACIASGMPSTTFYRRVAEIRMHLRMFGISAAA